MLLMSEKPGHAQNTERGLAGISVAVITRPCATVSLRQTGQLGQYEAELASLRQQLEQLLGRQRQLEEDNSRLQVTPDQLRRSLTHLTVSEARYQELSKMDAEAMSVIDFAAVSRGGGLRDLGSDKPLICYG